MALPLKSWEGVGAVLPLCFRWRSRASAGAVLPLEEEDVGAALPLEEDVGAVLPLGEDVGVVLPVAECCTEIGICCA